jgi:hypothetical protein
MEALLDFDMKLALDGKSLSKKEIETLLAATEGLVLIKGKWIEVDRDKLRQVLDQWRDVQKQAEAGGVSFGEAMRIHFDRWWNPAVENQATDRAFRIGQKKNVLVHKDEEGWPCGRPDRDHRPQIRCYLLG